MKEKQQQPKKEEGEEEEKEEEEKKKKKREGLLPCQVIVYVCINVGCTWKLNHSNKMITIQL